MENVAEAFLGLSREDFSLLGAIETGMRTHEWVPTFIISKLAGLSASKSEYRLQHLFEKKLVVREAQHYLGYQINFDSYDLLALSDFVRRDQVKSIGERIGVGKESIVLGAQGYASLAIKFHRQGRTSFKHVRRCATTLQISSGPVALCPLGSQTGVSGDGKALLEGFHPRRCHQPACSGNGVCPRRF